MFFLAYLIFFLKFIYFIYLFIFGCVGSSFLCEGFSCGERGPLFIAVRGPVTVAASLVAEHKLQTRRLSSYGSRGLVALRHVGSSQTRARTRVPCVGRQTLNNCATREAPLLNFFKQILSYYEFGPLLQRPWIHIRLIALIMIDKLLSRVTGYLGKGNHIYLFTIMTLSPEIAK